MQAGFILFERSQADRRSQILCLTPAALRLVRIKLNDVSEWIHKLDAKIEEAGVRGYPTHYSLESIERSVDPVPRNRSEDGIASLTDTIRIAPENGEAFLRRANLYLSLENAIEAIRDCTDAIKLLPGDPRPYVVRAQVHLSKSDYNNALADLEIATILNSQASWYLCYLKSQALNQSGQPKAAIDSLKTALEIAPYDSSRERQLLHYQRGLIFRALGEMERARADFSEAVKLAPDNSLGARELRQLQDEQGSAPASN